MSLAIIQSRANVGIEAVSVTIEAHITRGLPGINIVGLPEKVVRESKDRVRSALLYSHFEIPSRRIVINLAPADLPKEGGRFDLPIALGILAASKQIPMNALSDYEFAGELALSGELRGFSGCLPMAIACKKAHRTLIIPKENAQEASLPVDTRILVADHLTDICEFLQGGKSLSSPEITIQNEEDFSIDMQDVRGQMQAKRALFIAAAGQHSLLMAGPPGTGKTMLASRLPSILPLMSEAEALETLAIASTSGKSISIGKWKQRPFRQPHHTASAVALVGGGNPPKPGEISLAHNGVLFLDELPEFNRHVIETLREPLESGKILISRACHQLEFPARFQLISAMNPCPCGQFGNPHSQCRCTPDQIQRYHSRLSTPFLDRIDLHVTVPALTQDILNQFELPVGECSRIIREKVIQARDIQLDRQEKLNVSLSGEQLMKVSELSESSKVLLQRTIKEFNLSARAYHRVLRVARTIADIESETMINDIHLSEALMYRAKPSRFFS